jgi:hypothetical protein
LFDHHAKKRATSWSSRGYMPKSTVNNLGKDNDHAQSAAATIEALAFLKRFSREPSLQGGEDV